MCSIRRICEDAGLLVHSVGRRVICSSLVAFGCSGVIIAESILRSRASIDGRCVSFVSPALVRLDAVESVYGSKQRFLTQLSVQRKIFLKSRPRVNLCILQ